MTKLRMGTVYIVTRFIAWEGMVDVCFASLVKGRAEQWITDHEKDIAKPQPGHEPSEGYEIWELELS